MGEFFLPIHHLCACCARNAQHAQHTRIRGKTENTKSHTNTTRMGENRQINFSIHLQLNNSYFACKGNTLTYPISAYLPIGVKMGGNKKRKQYFPHKLSPRGLSVENRAHRGYFFDGETNKNNVCTSYERA